MACRENADRERQNGSARSGFTLVELLVCLAVMSLLMAVFAPALSGSSARARLEASAHDLAIALRETRDLALTRTQTESFALDGAKRAYQAGDEATPRALDRGIHVALVAAEGDPPAPMGVIRFFVDGSSTGGIVRLSLEKRRIDIQIDWLTGRVTLSDPSRDAQG